MTTGTAQATLTQPAQRFKQDPHWALLAGAVLLLAAVADLLIFQRTAAHALVVLALTATTIWATLLITDRGGLAGIAGLTVAAWPMIHATPGSLLIASLVPAIWLLLPPTPLARPPGWLSALIAVAATVLAGWILALPTTGLILAGAAALLFVHLQPANPTTGTLRTATQLALLIPALALALLLLINTATGRLEPDTVQKGMLTAVALAALAVLATFAALGLTTITASSSPRRHLVWASAAMAAAILVAAAWTRDAHTLRLAMSTAAAPLALLASLGVGRLASRGHPAYVALYLLPPLFAVASYSLV